MNTTAIIITAIICGTLVLFGIISEIGKTAREKIELEVSQNTPGSKFLKALFSGGVNNNEEESEV